VESPPSFEEIIRRRVLYTMPAMEPAQVREGLPYKSADGASLSFDLYAPAGASRPRPAVILIHGGPVPVSGARRWGMFVSYGEMLAALGLVGIVFDHRFVAPDRLPEAAADTADLVRYVREHAASLGVDKERLALWAFSGGGPLLAATVRQRPSWCKLIVGYYALMEFGGIANADEYSVVAALGDDGATAPPMLLVRAGLDNPALNATIDRLVAAAIPAGATVDLLTHPTGHHAFDILDPGERSRQIIRRTLDAIRGTLETA